MAETRTSRFGLVQWGVGTDSPSRIDFNEAFLNLESRAAYDDGASYVTMPAVNLVQGRYVLFAPGGANKTLYRRNAAGTWDYAGGNTDPDPFYLRPYSGVGGGGPARDTAALILSHPDGASGPGGSFAYDGSASLGGTLRVFDLNDATAGNVIIGAGDSVTANPAVTGRLHLRTRADGERALVLRPHGTGAGPLLAVQTTAGSDVLTLDATGRMQQRSAAGFGGASVPSDSLVAIAPTSGGADANGLTLHGQAAPGDTKTILRVLRQDDDAAALMQLGRDGFTIGRLPWGSTSSAGALALSGRQLLARASGYSGDPVLWRLTRADIADPANGSLDEPVATLSRQSSLFRAPVTLTQALSTGSVNLVLKRYTDLTQRFLELHRMGAAESVEVVGGWDSEGRVLAGARWAGAGVIRDARQVLRHASTKRYATPGVDGYTTGPKLDVPSGSLTYTFSSMQMRSATLCDLNITVETEYCLEFESDDFGHSSIYDVYVAVNGGSFSLIETREFWGHAVDNTDRPVGVAGTIVTTLGAVPVGATVQIRVRARNNGTGFGPAMYMRMFYVNVEESLITTYSAP